MPVLSKPHLSNGSATKGLSRLKDVKQPANQEGPLWLGPMNDGPLGGITQSIIASLIVDKERARIKLIEGLREEDKFSARMEFGNLFHCAEEHFLAGKDYKKPLLDYAKKLVVKYGNADSAEINKWYNVCLLQFPIYTDYWKKHKDSKKRVAVEQEQVFHVPYTLPSGRIVYLRGKRDAVDIVGKSAWVLEHKTKSEIDHEKLTHFLKLDLQSHYYLTAADIDPVLRQKLNKTPIDGVKYNVILRPLSGGKHSIRQKKGQTELEFYAELGERIRGNPKDFFARWDCNIVPKEVKSFQDMCLNPLLENACDDYEWWKECFEQRVLSPFDYETRRKIFPKHYNRHYTVPFGIYSPLFDGATTPLDNYILSNYKNETGLVRKTKLFEELDV